MIRMLIIEILSQGFVTVETDATLISMSKTRTFILRYLDGSFKKEKNKPTGW